MENEIEIIRLLRSLSKLCEIEQKNDFQFSNFELIIESLIYKLCTISVIYDAYQRIICNISLFDETMKRFMSPNPNESHSLSILNKGRSPYERRYRKGKNYRKSNYNSAIVVYVARAILYSPQFIPQPVREQKIQSEDSRAQNSQSHRLQLVSAVRRLFPIWQASQTQHFRCQPIIERIAVIRFARTALLLPISYRSFFLLFLLRSMSSSFSMSSSPFLFSFSQHFARTLFLSIFLHSSYLHSFHSSFHCLRSSFADHLILHLRFFQKTSYFLRKNPE